MSAPEKLEVVVRAPGKLYLSLLSGAAILLLTGRPAFAQG